MQLLLEFLTKTDFHSLFIAQTRSLNIPARFIMGLPLPEKKKEGLIAGYHCWAEFYLPQKGWQPIDASEANKFPEKKDEFFFKDNGGGITFSGGEPLYQPEFFFDLAWRLQTFHLVLDTSGYASKKIFKIALSLVDYVLFDVKHMDSEEHKKYTGVSNEIILENLKVLINGNIPFVVRVPLIPGVNDSDLISTIMLSALGVGLGVLLLTFVAGFAYDIER